jgi:geranylgeranyl diphosphate synthase, type II
VLEQAFPYMESAGIPGIAIPLLQGDCKNTSVDMDCVWDAIHLTSDDRTWRLDLDDLRGQVAGWFELESLERLAGPAVSQTERIARDYLARHGKRWRPFLLACVYVALAQDPTAPLPEELKKLAVAVECFHKASLVHDDIEDDDETRYGEKTVHAEHGMPVALNVGDLLLGEGYRLIAQCGANADTVARMLNVAAEGHRTLCLGQGAELWWGRDPVPLSTLEVLDIFRKKTSPAFEVALGLGAAFAGADPSVGGVLARYCEALGIAYQIRDDLEDLAAGHGSDDLSRLRPSLPLAVALEQAEGEDRRLLELAWRRGPVDARPLRDIIRRTGAEERCHGLLDSYRQQAVRSLAELENASLKGLLRRVVSKVFGIEIKGWCGEFEARNAPGGATGVEAAG